ncbi:MAG: hypothetical protein HZB92_05615 [Euryarchaeota archaeon]|nr:hypothetical protein [Euryarchaeota archaeon]
MIIVRGWKNSLAWAALCGVIGILPDADHLFGWMYAHNLFLLVLAPSLAFMACYLIGNVRGHGITVQRASILFTAILPGHLLLDLAETGGIPLMWPMSSNLYVLKSGALLWAYGRPVLDYPSALLLLWVGLTFLCTIAETRLYRQKVEIGAEWEDMPGEEDAQLFPVWMTLTDGAPIIT